MGLTLLFAQANAQSLSSPSEPLVSQPSTFDFSEITAENWRSKRIEMYRQHLKAERELRLQQRQEHQNSASMSVDEKKALRARQKEARKNLRAQWLKNRELWRDSKNLIK